MPLFWLFLPLRYYTRLSPWPLWMAFLVVGLLLKKVFRRDFRTLYGDIVPVVLHDMFFTKALLPLSKGVWCK
jgi:hypothetical protein